MHLGEAALPWFSPLQPGSRGWGHRRGRADPCWCEEEGAAPLCAPDPRLFVVRHKRPTFKAAFSSEALAPALTACSPFPRVVKEEISDDNAKLPCFNGRVVSWVSEPLRYLAACFFSL